MSTAEHRGGILGRVGLAWRGFVAEQKEQGRRHDVESFARRAFEQFAQNQFPDNLKRFSGETVVDLSLFEPGTILRFSAYYKNIYGKGNAWHEWVAVASNIERRKVEVYKAEHPDDIGHYHLHGTGTRLVLFPRLFHIPGWCVERLEPSQQQFKARDAFKVLFPSGDTASRYDECQIDIMETFPNIVKGLRVDDVWEVRSQPQLGLAGAGA